MGETWFRDLSRAELRPKLPHLDAVFQTAVELHGLVERGDRLVFLAERFLDDGHVELDFSVFGVSGRRLGKEGISLTVVAKKMVDPAERIGDLRVGCREARGLLAERQSIGRGASSIHERVPSP